MPNVNALQGKAIHIKLCLGGRSVPVTGADQKTQDQLFVTPILGDRHNGTEPGNFVITTPQSAEGKIVPSVIIKIEGLCARWVTLDILELRDINPLTVNAGLDFLELFGDFLDCEKHIVISTIKISGKKFFFQHGTQHMEDR